MSLKELEESEPISTALSILLAQVITYRKTGTKPNDKSLYSRVSQSTKQSNNFDRTMTLMCLKSPPGSNTMIVTLDGRKSDEVFSQCLSARDSKDGFGPGAIVAIRGPEMISTYFGEKSGLPVLQFTGGMKLVNKAVSRITFSTIPSSSTVKRMHAFFYEGVKVTLRQMNMAMTNCCGNLCDSIDMKSSDGTWKSSCPCFVVSKGIGSIVFDLNFSVKTPQGASFEVLRFTSRSFTGLLTRNGFPSSINVEQIEKAGADYHIYSQLEQRIQNINDNGGFDILGWIRIGLKNDVSSAEGLKVRSSDMVRHVTRMRAHNALPFPTDKLINVEEILTEVTRPTLSVASAKTADKSNLDDTSKQPSLPAASAERAGKSNLDDDSKKTAEFV